MANMPNLIIRPRRQATGLRPILMATVGFALVVPHGQAFAQAAGAQDEEGDQIVVTAERRDGDLQTTSVSMAVLSSEDLDNQGVRDQADLQNITPSLSVAPQGFTTNVNIRGIGLNLQSATVVSGVAIYRDGLFAPGPTLANMPYYDIASIEVLRGPQGTFVGQNSTGGAILMNSRDPDFGGAGGNIEGQVGTYSNFRLRGAVNLPVSETVAARIAFTHESRDSFYENVGAGVGEPGNLNDTSVRAGLLWEPSSSLSALLKAEYYVGKSDGYAYTPIPGTDYAPFVPNANDPFVLAYDRADTRSDAEAIGVSLKLEYETSGGMMLRSVSGYQHSTLDLLFDMDGSPAPGAALPGPGQVGQFQPEVVEEEVITQEFNVISPDTGWFSWILGGTYMHRVAGALLIPTTVDANGVVLSAVEIDATNPIDSFGVFGQATFAITPTLDFQAGLRWSHDTVDSTGSITVTPPGIVIPADLAPQYSKGVFTGKLGLNWTVNDDHFIYAFAAKGYKTGGPNIGAPVGFEPEVVWDYELGWKADLFAGAVRTQINGFYMTYENFQVNQFNPFIAFSGVTGLTSNSEIYGIEASADARFGNLRLNANLGYVHSRLGAASLIDIRTLPPGTSNLVQCAPGQSPPGCFDYSNSYIDISGSRNPYSPEITLNVGAEYDIEIGDGTLTPRIDFTHIGEQFATVFQNPVFDLLGQRNLLNAQLRYANGDWLVTLYGTNLTKEVYATGVQPSFANRYLGPPRQFGVRVSRDF